MTDRDIFDLNFIFVIAPNLSRHVGDLIDAFITGEFPRSVFLKELIEAGASPFQATTIADELEKRYQHREYKVGER
jgi:hypothetical protein